MLSLILFDYIITETKPQTHSQELTALYCRASDHLQKNPASAKQPQANFQMWPGPRSPKPFDGTPRSSMPWKKKTEVLCVV